MIPLDLNAGNPAAEMSARSVSRIDRRVGIGVLLLLCVFALFVRLGAAALFDPDEGRNAEKAREILLLHDWITPHQNFVPVLDKPIAYYWLVAASYRAFGVSEWSARLPSVLAAASCVALIFFFARRFFGFWEGLWGSLILVTSLEFYLLARIVIFDMTLTFFTTLALFAFFYALREPKGRRRTGLLALMYLSSAAATLVKGPIGVVLPGLVAFAYLLASRQLRLLRELGLPFGIPLFFAVVAPWYIEVERFNPGYLRYFLWEENFIRYLTPHFNRTEGWYYFLVVLAVGFLPWTLCIPGAIREAWRGRRDDTVLFLLLWALLPLLFFSFSKAKLPHYILPMFPPLALLTGIHLESKRPHGSHSAGASPLVLGCLGLCSVVACFMVAAEVPRLFRGAAQFALSEISSQSQIIAPLGLAAAAAVGVWAWNGKWKGPMGPFVGISLALLLYLELAGHAIAASSVRRSTRDFAAKASPYIKAGDQLVIYDTELESLLYYLKINEPIWVVWSGRKSSVMGSFYLAENGVRSLPGAAPVLLTFEDFSEQVAKMPENHFAVFIKKKNLPRLQQEMGQTGKVLLEDSDLLLVSN